MVSVIIPCYNVEDYVAECIDSVKSQTFRDIEIICIDNNSNDKTWQVLISLQKTFPELKLGKETKPGANAARNKGLGMAEGEWVQFLDADDLLESTKIEHQLSLINKQKNNFAFVAASYKRLSVDGNITKSSAINPDKFISIFENRSGITSSNLWNKNALSKVGSWKESLQSSQEADLMLRILLEGGEYLVDDEPLTIIRERAGGQISQSHPARRWSTYLDVYLSFLNALKIKFPEIYKKNLGFYQDSLMVTILILARADSDRAYYYYKNFIKGRWRSSNSVGFNPLKVMLIKVLGFKFFLKITA